MILNIIRLKYFEILRIARIEFTGQIIMMYHTQIGHRVLTRLILKIVTNVRFSKIKTAYGMPVVVILKMILFVKFPKVNYLFSMTTSSFKNFKF